MAKLRAEYLAHIVSSGGGARPTNQLGSSNSIIIAKTPYWSKKAMTIKNAAYTIDHPTKAQLDTRIKFGNKARAQKGRKGFDVVTNPRSKAVGMSLTATAAAIANSRIGRSSFSKGAGQHASELRRSVHTLEELRAMRSGGSGVVRVSTRKRRKSKSKRKAKKKARKSRKAKKSRKKARKVARKTKSKSKKSKRRKKTRSVTVFSSMAVGGKRKASLPQDRVVTPASGRGSRGRKSKLIVMKIPRSQLKKARGALSSIR